MPLLSVSGAAARHDGRGLDPLYIQGQTFTSDLGASGNWLRSFRNKRVRSLHEHGFCRASLASWRVDVFVPTIPFYEQVKARRKRVFLGDVRVTVLDAESLAVFKMMFFRPQDIVDIGEILRIQGAAFDRDLGSMMNLVKSSVQRTLEWPNGLNSWTK